MKENIDITKLPMLNVGIVGHIDHGKTTLLYKLTGKWTDTHSEELKRGITIKLGYADLILKKEGENYFAEKGEPARYISFVDAPGHEMLMATMLSGAAIMDAAILVIAANEGIMPQTREHLVALEAKKINKIIIVQNKIDLVAREKAIESYNAIKEFVKGTIAENAPIIPISAQQGINLDKIFNALGEIEVPERDTTSEPVFLIARSFDINRPGTLAKDLKGGVLGGALKKGTLKTGDEIEIKPGRFVKKGSQSFYEPVKTRINSIFKGNYKINEATPGGSIALETELDPVLTKTDSLSGCVAGLVGKLPEPISKLRIKTQLFKELIGTKEKTPIAPIKTTELLLISVNTTISVGPVMKIKNNEIELSLRIPIVPMKGDNVGLARNVNGHWRLIGFGEII